MLSIVLQIVWDPEKKKWTNTEHDECEETAFKPPPKMPGFTQNQFANAIPAIPTTPSVQLTETASLEPSNSMGNVPMTYGNASTSSNFGNAPQPNSIAATDVPAKVPSLQSNKFKMQRNRGE